MALKDRGGTNSVGQSPSWLKKKSIKSIFSEFGLFSFRNEARKTDEPLSERKSYYIIINIVGDRESPFH